MDILPHDRAARRTNLLAQRELDRNMSEGTISNLEPIDGVWWTGDLQVKRRDIIGSVAKPLTDFHLAYIDIVSSIDFQINCVIEESTGDEQEKAESDAKVDVYKDTDLDETLRTRGRKHVYQTRLSSKNDRGGSHSYVGKAWFRHAQQEMTEVARV
jgi:hypothetical protein